MAKRKSSKTKKVSRKKTRKILKLFFWVLSVFILGGVAGVFGERFVMPWLSTVPALGEFDFVKRANDKVTVINQTKEITVKEDFSVANIAEKVSPAVVSIVSFKDEKSLTRSSQIKSSQDIQENIKTGLILTNDGLIISVLDEALKEILAEEEGPDNWKFKILAENGKEFDAKILAVDDFSNLVFFKAEKQDLPIPNFGDSDNVEVGEKVVICGNAGGEYQNSFSTGLIKEKDQTFTLLNSELSSSEKMEGVILLDAKIERRNIGGPVIDYNGEVVGIVNQIEKDGQQIGFVVPVNDLKQTINKVLEKKTLATPILGVYYLSINREIALLNGLDLNRGALVYSFSGQQGLAVIKDSPADKAGIKIGDIVLAVDGQPVDLSNPLSKLVAKNSPGDEIEIKLIRDGENINLKVILE